MQAVEPNRLQELEAAFDADACLIRSGDRLWVAFSSLEYAILLLRRDQGGDRGRAAGIIEAVLATQMQAPAWDHGRFPMSLPETWRDLNATLFMAPHLVEIYAHWLPMLPAELAARFCAAVMRAVDAVDRRWADEVFDVHRDFKAYSNIFVLYIRALLLLGRCLDNERLRRDGEAQWQRWFNHVSTFGIDEFCSPTYNEVVYEGLLGIRTVAAEPRMQAEVGLVLDHLCALQHAVSHPLLGLGVVGTARDYRLFVKPGGGAFRFLGGAGDAEYHPPAVVLEEYRRRAYPYRAAGRAGLVPFRFQTWQLRDAAMGSMTGGHYFPQQIHLMVAVGTSPTQRACAFFQADGWNPINGYVRQRDHRALCLFARTATSYRLTQLRQPVGELPLTGTQAPCLGLTPGWTVREHRPGLLVVAAHGHALHVRTFALAGDRLEPATLTPETMEINGQQINGWRAAPGVVWLACLAELLPDGASRPDEPALNGSIGEDLVTLSEPGGLALKLVRRPSGELVELYDEDPRALPLFESPTHRLWPGDLAAASDKTATPIPPLAPAPFSPLAIALEPGPLRYNPCQDLIFPSVLNVRGLLPEPLGTYYMYYAPHNAPGGICLAYADAPLGPWIEYPENPVIARQWPPHYEVSHVSSPHALWAPAERQLQLFYHGENTTTRQAFSRDGIHFEYGGVAVEASQVLDTTAAFYARALYHPAGSPHTGGLLLWFGHSPTCSGIYGARSADGRQWTPLPRPVLAAREAGATYVCAPCPFILDGRYYVAFHADFPRSPDQPADLMDTEGPLTDIYVCAIAPDLTRHGVPVRLLGREAFGPDNDRISDPCILVEGGDVYLYCTVGRRLAQKVAVCRAPRAALAGFLREACGDPVS